MRIGTDNTMAKENGQKDKQRLTKHYTENKRIEQHKSH